MKKLVITLLAFLTIFSFTACNSNNKDYEEYQPTQGSMFACIESYEDPYLGAVTILVDRETRIMYMHYWENASTDYGVSGITVLYDSDGKPKKYNGVITE